MALPVLDVTAILANDHKFCSIADNKENAIKWALSEYSKTGLQVPIAEKLGVPYQTVLHWLKKYGIYKPFDTKTKQKKFLRTPEFSEKVKLLRARGITSYEALARMMKCDPTVIRRLAQDEEWLHKSQKYKFDIPKSKIETELLNFKDYRNKIHRYTHKLSYYFSSRDQILLRDTNMHIDHKLSIYEAFHNKSGIIAWQYVCHPCNLQIITSEENQIKGPNSCISSQDLFSRIRLFKQTHGKVTLPMKDTMPKLIKEI